MSDEPAAPRGDGGLVRLRLEIAYDGTDFSGWARQPGLRTVQGELELALTRSLRLEAPARLTCAGRTDAGVHATGQVAHVDVAGSGWEPWTLLPTALVTRLARATADDVKVSAIAAAPPGFDARWSASARRYSYRVCDDPAGPAPRDRRYVYALRSTHRLDLEVMNAAAQDLVGEHDFAAFCRRRPGASTVRTLERVEWSRDPFEYAALDIEADAFCHSMVRSLVGALLAVGSGRTAPAALAHILDGRVRPSTVTVAPPHGLTLEEVRYPDEASLIHSAERARRFRL